MVKVEILSGNQAGQVVEMGRTEAQAACDTGYARAVDELPAPIGAAPATPADAKKAENPGTGSKAGKGSKSSKKKATE